MFHNLFSLLSIVRRHGQIVVRSCN